MPGLILEQYDIIPHITHQSATDNKLKNVCDLCDQYQNRQHLYFLVTLNVNISLAIS